MHTDPITGTRIPDSTDATNVWQYFANVAGDLSSQVAPRFATTAARDTAFAAWVTAGNTMVAGMLSVVGPRLWRYTGTGTTWEYVPSFPTAFSTLAARNSFFSGARSAIAGDSCICLGVLMTHDGTKWRFTLSGIYSGTTDANGFLSIPHGGGQAPTSWVIAPAYQGDSSNFAVKVLSSNNAGDATFLGCRLVYNNASYATSVATNVTWMAQF